MESSVPLRVIGYQANAATCTLYCGFLFLLDALTAPMLVFTATPPAVVDVLIGESIVLPCQAGGFPQATLVWRFQKQEVSLHFRFIKGIG